MFVSRLCRKLSLTTSKGSSTLILSQAQYCHSMMHHLHLSMLAWTRSERTPIHFFPVSCFPYYLIFIWIIFQGYWNKSWDTMLQKYLVSIVLLFDFVSKQLILPILLLKIRVFITSSYCNHYTKLCSLLCHDTSFVIMQNN